MYDLNRIGEIIAELRDLRPPVSIAAAREKGDPSYASALYALDIELDLAIRRLTEVVIALDDMNPGPRLPDEQLLPPPPGIVS
jgi:hypothetical protein